MEPKIIACTTMGKQVSTGERYVLLFLFLSILSGQASALTSHIDPDHPAGIVPFEAHVPDRVLIDLKRRLADAKWPDQLPRTSWEYGADIKKVQELATHWQKQYNWSAHEAGINHFHQYTAEIEGQQIHFIYVRSTRPDAIPLLLIHGWPGTLVEFLGLIEPLTHPASNGTPTFDVVIPSLPGFGFSGPTPREVGAPNAWRRP
jgi:epoxide hydrolase